jgi:hypothetical protein
MSSSKKFIWKGILRQVFICLMPPSLLGYCLWWPSNFAGSESGHLHSFKLLRNVLSNGTPHPHPLPATHCKYIRGLQCFKLNGIQTENVRYLQKNNFLLFAKCLKMYSFSHLNLKYAKSATVTQKYFFLKNINMGIKKNAEFYADFKFVDADLNKCP